MNPGNTTPSAKAGRQAFTLIEMLVVIAIIALLASLIVPTVSALMRRAKAVTCLNNLRGIGQAQIMYATQNKGRFTPVWTSEDPTSWMERLLPHLEADEDDLVKLVLDASSILNCPLRERPGDPTTSYGLNYSLTDSRWNFYMNRIKKPSQVILAGDQVADTWNEFIWYPDSSQEPPAFRHDDQAHVVFCDGHAGSYTREELQGTPVDLWRPSDW